MAYGSELSKEIKEFLKTKDFMNVLQGTQLILGAKVSYTNGILSIDSVYYRDIPANTIKPKDLEKFEKHLEQDRRLIIDNISIDYQHDYKVFKSMLQVYNTELIKNNFKVNLNGLKVTDIAVNIYDVTGNYITRIIYDSNTRKI